MKIGVLLSGCGVYDGAEIQEAVFTLLSIHELGHEYVPISIDENQFHVLNHMNGEEIKETRNMMIESARISRGNITNITNIDISNLNGLVIPGGFGSAKNFSDWAFKGPDGEIHGDVKNLILGCYNAKIPVAAICVSPVLLGKAFETSDVSLNLTIGSEKESSPYTIADFENGLRKTGARTEQKTIKEILVDEENKIVTAPCYMMDASISEIRQNVKMAVEALVKLI